MSLLSPIRSLFGGEQYTIPTPDSSLILDLFVLKNLMYCRTPTKWLKKPVHKSLFMEITKNEYEYELSAYRTKMNQSQAKGLLKYTQGVLPL